MVRDDYKYILGAFGIVTALILRPPWTNGPLTASPAGLLRRLKALAGWASPWGGGVRPLLLGLDAVVIYAASFG